MTCIIWANCSRCILHFHTLFHTLEDVHCRHIPFTAIHFLLSRFHRRKWRRTSIHLWQTACKHTACRHTHTHTQMVMLSQCVSHSEAISPQRNEMEREREREKGKRHLQVISDVQTHWWTFTCSSLNCRPGCLDVNSTLTENYTQADYKQAYLYLRMKK